MSLSTAMIHPSGHQNILSDPSSPDSESLIRNIYSAVLSAREDRLESDLRLLYKLVVVYNHTRSLRFLLFQVQWFEDPFVRHLDILEKLVRWHCGKGKEEAIVGYNIILESLYKPSLVDVIPPLVSRLIEKRYDLGPLIKSLTQNYPHKNRATEIHEGYISGLLGLVSSSPRLRQSIFSLIVDRICLMDTQVEVGDKYLHHPFMDGNQQPDYKGGLQIKAVSPMTQKLDTLIVLVTKYFVNQGSNTEVSQILLHIFNKTVLKAQKTKFIQFLFFHLAQTNKEFGDLFLSLLLDNMLGASQTFLKQNYVNSALYLGSYLVRSKRCPRKRIISCLEAVMVQISTLTTDKQYLLTPDLNLFQMLLQNQKCLYLIQLLMHVSIFKGEIFVLMETRIRDLLHNSQDKILFSLLLNPEIVARFNLLYSTSFTCLTQHQNEKILYENKFNPVLIPKFAQLLNPYYMLYDTRNPAGTLKRGPPPIAQKPIVKKIKKSSASEETNRC